MLTTGAGSGKSLAYIVPIVDHVLRRGPGRGVQAVVVYPMNALANSQAGELTKFLGHGFPDGRGPVRFARYTGQEGDEQRRAILADPPDILLTNYVMLELILTRPDERGLVRAASGLRFLVLDELHTHRGRQGSDVAMLVRRVREATGGDRRGPIADGKTDDTRPPRRDERHLDVGQASSEWPARPGSRKTTRRGEGRGAERSGGPQEVVARGDGRRRSRGPDGSLPRPRFLRHRAPERRPAKDIPGRFASASGP